MVACATPDRLSGLPEELEPLGARVEVTTEGLKAFDLARAGGIELIVLAEPLGALAGQALCKALREANVGVPILLLDTPERQVAGLEAGADVVLPLDCPAALWKAQVQALLRRVSLERQPLRAGDLSLDTQTRQAMRGGKQIHLSTTEYTLLELLLRRAGRVVSRDEIMKYVWPGEERTSDNVLDVYISYLRNKIDRGFAAPLVRTVRGQGYVIAVD